MANERRGILYETIAAVALEKAIHKANIQGELFWNKKPSTMSVVPDFTIGTDVDHPSHVIMITASGATHNSHMKMWRNLSELQESKAQLPKVPVVISIYFKTEVKAGVMEVTQQLYDSVLYVDTYSYYRFLEEWVQANTSASIANKDLKSDLLKRSMQQDLTLSQSVDALASDLAEALTQRNAELEPLWQLMRQDYLNAAQPPVARTTSVRRGLAKLLVLEPSIRQLIYASYRRNLALPIDQLPNYVFDLQFLTKHTAGARLTDDEIRGVLNLLGPQVCEEILEQAPAAMNSWINPLRDLGRVGTHVDFVESHYHEFTEAASLQNLLTKCYQDPVDLSGEPGDEKVWIYEIIVSLLKAKSGQLQGYGLAQLAVDTKTPEFGEGGFLIPPFVQRQKFLRPEHISALAEGLSSRFKKEITLKDLMKLKHEVVTWVIKENLEDRLIPYRNFEPLLWLLETELQKQGKLYVAKTTFGGWINEYANAGKRSATTPFVQVGNTLIHWKTVSDAGKVHKKKELAARERSVRYQYDTKLKKFGRRLGIHQTVLIVDGTFDDSDLRVLTEAGWDMIIYPDEIAELVRKL